jgi:4-amino-4-deoxy-L-arabinose transferase-like glycosyltransferase
LHPESIADMKKFISSLTQLNDTTLLVLIGLGVTLFHVLTNGQYGFHRDELDLLMSAHQLAWGYVSYPPLAPFLARVGLTLFGASLTGARVMPALAQGVVAVLVGLMARDFGGKRLAQITAAVAVAIAPLALTSGILIQYMSFDYLWWVLLAFFFVRLLSTENPRWWLGMGAAIGLGMMTKYTMAFFIAGLVVAILLTSTRRYLRSPWLWMGAGVALLIFLPDLVWQIQHHLIAIPYLSFIHARDVQEGRAKSYLVDQLYANTNPITLPLWVAGLIFCAFRPDGKKFRALAWMFLATFLLLLVSQGRSYYLAPAYPMLLAAGSAWLESWLGGLARPRFVWLRGTLAGLLALGGVAGALLTEPVTPIHSPVWNVATKVNDGFVEMIGWPGLVQDVANVYAKIPAGEKAGTVVLAGNYGEAGALELYGPALGLPRMISGANSLWARGYGSPVPQTVILVGFDSGYAGQLFSDCTLAGTLTNQARVNNEETRDHTQFFVCHQPRLPWDKMWPNMQWFQ